ncbi:hypothetical protein C6A85_57795, partial [Mycobacterium sp. ITM-2017-0098]
MAVKLVADNPGSRKVHCRNGYHIRPEWSPAKKRREGVFLMMFWNDYDMSGWGYAGMAIGMIVFWMLIVVGIIGLI